MKNKKFYVTTAIDYVNARPHCGHAFEKVLADAVCRWKRLKGEKVFFLTGTDENAQKNAQAAKKEGIPTKQFVDKNSGIFIELCEKLNISNDDFIRTTEARHVKVVQEIFKKIYEKGDIYNGKYEGLYCTGCEEFKIGRDLINGRCPEHNIEPELLSEDAYFFKLSKYKSKLVKFIQNYIIPEGKKNEILARLEGEELRDLCVSRTKLDWGIDNPLDKKFKIYVWIDALTNYISGSSGNWPADLHVIGKGINWFHSVIWPAILLSAGYELPRKLLVHGYLNLSGQKISKSLGNVIDPIELIDKYGADAVRYSLLKCSAFDDSDYSDEILISRNNSELADKFGNLISRVSALAEKFGIEKCENKLFGELKLKEIEKKIDGYEFDKALNLIFEFIDICNLYVQENKIWESGDKKRLYELCDSIKAIAILLSPFIPSSCEKIAKQFSFKLEYGEIKKPLKVTKISKSQILFSKIEGNSFTKESKSIKPKEKVNKATSIEGVMATGKIPFSEWEKLDLRVAQIKKVEDIDGADKLYKLTVNVGELGERTICAGIKKYYQKDKLKGKKIIVIANLEPRVLKGIESQGMLLAAGHDKDKCVLLTPDSDIEVGSKIS